MFPMNSLWSPVSTSQVCVNEQSPQLTSPPSLTLCSPDDHKTVVELAAGATLSAAYFPGLFHQIFPEVLPKKRSTIVFIVCGGFKITLADLSSYQTHLETRRAEEFDVWVNDFHFKTRME